MSTLQVLGEIKLVGSSATGSVKLNNGLEKVTGYHQEVVELDPNDDQLVTFDVAKDFVYFDCNKSINYTLNGGITKIRARRIFMQFGTDITSIHFFNDSDENPVKVVIKLISANGTVF